MKKLWRKIGDVIPVLWGVMWVVLITLISLAGIIASAQWLIKLIGVI